MASAYQYISTRGGMKPVGFCDAVLTGLAPDGGLVLPAAVPDVRDRLDAWQALPYPQLAAEVMACFVGPDLPRRCLDTMADDAYAAFDHPDVIPVLPVGEVHVMELFHGPTLAFKDVALQFLGHLFEHILRERGTSLNILGATSGDTGSAAIAGVRGKPNIEIFIMHPRNRVSPIQERQMTTVLDDNVHNIAIEGTFDDGQRILKELFRDLEFKRTYRLGAINSVNWARVLAQIVYYFHAAFRMREATGCEAIQAAVPTGNFGDIFAGYMARRMGAPVDRLILATNANDILCRFFREGTYELGQVHSTLSPSMDIQVASNFERYLYYRLNQDPGWVAETMTRFQKSGVLDVPGQDPAFVAGQRTDEQTLQTIARYKNQHQYLLDPHTAVGVSVAEEFLRADTPTVCLATAHPAKFQHAIRRALGQDDGHHPAIDALFDKPTRCETLPADAAAVADFIRNTLKTPQR